MRLATYNVDNLFERPLAFASPGRGSEDEVLLSYAALRDLIALKDYAPVRDQIAAHLRVLGLEKSDEGPYAILRQNHGHLIERHGSKLTVTAAGRDAWMGWVELETAFLPDPAVENTGRVIADVGADVQAIVEVEDRAVLRTLAKDVIEAAAGERYAHARELEGNDLRGINVGLLARSEWNVDEIRTHVDDTDGDGHRIFSRDCPEYTVTDGAGAEVVVLVNHFKSQIGSKASNDEKRRLQSARVAEIYERLRGEGHENVAVVGDLNATPDSQSLVPLLSADLQDVAGCENFDDGTSNGASANGERLRGTYGEGKKQFDYVLLSPPLFDRLRGAGIYRKGTWTKHGDWEMYDSMQQGRIQNAASDHALVWADIDL